MLFYFLILFDIFYCSFHLVYLFNYTTTTQHICSNHYHCQSHGHQDPSTTELLYPLFITRSQLYLWTGAKSCSTMALRCTVLFSFVKNSSNTVTVCAVWKWVSSSVLLTISSRIACAHASADRDVTLLAKNSMSFLLSKSHV